MTKIYGQSAQTLVWLGEQDGVDVHNAFTIICDIINQWDESVNATYKMDGENSYQKNNSPLHDGGIVQDWKRMRLLDDLFAARWFHRRWVIQEVVLSPSATVFCRNFAISWEWVGLAAAIVRTTSRWFADQGLLNAYLIYRLGQHGTLNRRI